MRTFPRAGVLVAASSAVFLLAPAAHATGDDTYTVQLRQQLPRTATTDDGGAPRESRDECPGVPDGKDGWHFVLPGKEPEFVKLTVTFEPGGQQVLTSFGPPSDKHAYVWSLPGAELTSAVAEVRGGELDLFNLSHTCPVTGGTPSGSADPSSSTSTEPSSSTSAEPSTGTSTEPATSTGAASPSAGGAATPSSSPAAGATGGDLAETGNGAPVGALSAVAAVLVAAGGFLVFHRRRGARRG
ncbi:LPXTG cell wall anchor domain-containing protein [Streptomyces sp. NPDC014995]|uniref:LPXTG cell wall anchor domain-containing protein n=1 Tax=Streptomyces sp. NPDC014995 TaxID=3364936 RepID=UPI0036F7B74E